MVCLLQDSMFYSAISRNSNHWQEEHLIKITKSDKIKTALNNEKIMII